MPKLIKDGQLIEDTWVLIEDTEADTLPEGKVIIPFTLWEKQKATLKGRTGLGIWLDSHDEPEGIASELEIFDLIAVNFPKFADGRGYSIAHILKDQLGFKGELRAIGDVLPDQLHFMRRCGFNSFALRDDKKVDQALHCINSLSNAYQAAADESRPLFLRR